VIRAVADSNIYVSALQFGGNPERFLELARSGQISLAIPNDILEEVAGVLREKFGWPPQAIDLAMDRLGDFTVRVAPTKKLNVVKEDPDDNLILECAVEAKSDYLVTRDKHLLKFKTFGPTKILLVADFLEMFRRRGQER